MKRLAAVFCILLALLFFGMGVANERFSFLKIRKVSIHSSIPIAYGLETLSTENILFLDTERIKQTILLRNPLIKELTIEKQFPDALTIIAFERIPAAWVARGSKKWRIDEDGVLLIGSLRGGENLPVIDTSAFPLYIKGMPDWRIKRALTYIRLMREQSLGVSEIGYEENSDSFHIRLLSSEDIVVPTNLDPKVAAASLQLIVSRFRIEGKSIQTVDFRFDKPVVRFSNGEKISPL